MDEQELTVKAKQILQDNYYMTIATASKDGQPWISPVAYAFDESYKFYWTSPEATRHSELIRSNPHIAIVVYDTKAPLKKGEAVYIEAEAYEIADDADLLEAVTCYMGRLSPKADPIRIEDYTNGYPGKFYKAIPKHIWVLANENKYLIGGYPMDRKVEVKLV